MAKPRKHILIVDDEPAWLKILSYILRKKGFEVREESGAEEALACLKEFNPDLIVSDVRMPMMSGFDLLEKIKNSRKHAKTPFVFVTAIDDLESRKTAMELGAADYLTKPFNEDEVVEVLSRHVQSLD